MRIPLSWLREYAQVPADATAEDVMADLVRVGLEEEDVHRPLDGLSGPIVVGEVLEMVPEPQSNGKTINWCQVRVAPEGAPQPLTGEGIDPSGVQGIVCGAHNFQVGDKVIVTLPGAVLPGDFRISPRSTYGHVSAGMIASARELGLGEDHDGIIVLSRLGFSPENGNDPEPGTDVVELLHLDDEAAEINVTPDRGYAFSIRGVAREYAHATGTAFTDPASLVTVPEADGAGYPVRLEDGSPIYGVPGCDRFVARTVTGIDPTRPTPPWMSARLRLAGMRSISLVVDISNYVMWELGQPLHFYDADTLRGDIVVRRAREGERLTTLDGKDRALSGEDLLITDDRGPIGLAGVMGGGETEVSDTTTTVLIESAHFDPVSMGRTRRRHRLPSEASKRNERGVDWEVADEAAERAVQLLVELAGGTPAPGITDVGTRPAPTVVELPASFPSALMGVEYTEEQVERTLTDLGATVEKGTDAGSGGTVFTVTAPSWRTDLRIREDLVEEVGRLVGYEHIPSTVPVAPAGRGLTRSQAARRRVSQGLADAGLTEVLAYPFVSAAQNRLFGSATAEEAGDQRMVHLANPISAEFGYLRTSLLPGLLEIARRNHSRGFRDLALYETGLVFLPGQTLGSATIPPLGVRPSDEVLAELGAGIPDQPRHVAAVLTGHDSAPGPGHAPRAWDWQDALGAALDVADLLGVELEVAQGRHQAFHPGRTAELRLAGGARTVVGYAGELLPKWLEEHDLPARTVAAELDLDALIAAAPEVVVAAPLSTFPPTSQDVALVVDADVVAGDVLDTLREGAGELLEDIALFDVYAGQGVPEGRKSLAFSLRFRAPDRTLTADEASEARGAATALAAERHGAVRR
ncbi:phenylalanine--tRNA ligase subunit beta [Citricoccus sp. SGAir0253]|uniref:phenylalanine--tRNA ligase subunit beta n=1 Tax=Citricoccus sp. SGAir0253 TaxID=2567881 RepID=UPI0010CCD1BB|nr:phenylalanine--tRNA ligase subunit beta [Citricoccus sp. SGAir0253]QCU77771.1 phenylalanine--tRNA ligase subunit beta [Citricoccus sp. SGAir0253]